VCGEAQFSTYPLDLLNSMQLGRRIQDALNDGDSDTEGGPLGSNKVKAGAGGCCCCLLLLILATRMIRTIPPASVGVVTTFGSTGDGTLQSGIHVTNPFAQVTIFPTKTVLFEEDSAVPTREGLVVRLEVAVLYRIVPEKAAHIFLALCGNFQNTYLKPQLASAVRGVTGSVAAEALYNSTREEIQLKLQQTMKDIMDPHGVSVESVLLKDIVLPKLLKDAIESKTAAQQEAERMEYVIDKEKREAQRKEIEAKGIQKFQDIVSQGISSKLLQWKGIEATQDIAKSSNSKIVLMGNSKGSLPILMSNDGVQGPLR